MARVTTRSLKVKLTPAKVRKYLGPPRHYPELAERVDQPGICIGLAWTAEDDGRVVMCGGLLPQWENRALAWALIGENAGAHFAMIHRHVKQFLTLCPYRRIEAHVDVGFAAGVRWMKMLGFELEAYKKAFRPDGPDMLEFVRIRS